jgi:hypothetical protein
MRLSTFWARKVQPLPAPEPSPMNVFTKPESLEINDRTTSRLSDDLWGKTLLEIWARCANSQS